MDYSKEIKLTAPSSMAVRVQIAELLSGSPSIAGAAALGVCWRGAGAPGVRWKTGKAADYGTAVFDKLLDSGMSWSRLNELAVEAVHRNRPLPPSWAWAVMVGHARQGRSSKANRILEAQTWRSR